MAVVVGDATRYLKNTLNEVLARALHEVCQARPIDPIEFLAKCLYKATDCQLYYQEKAVFEKEMQLMANKMKREDKNRQSAISRHKKHIQELKRIVHTIKKTSTDSRVSRRSSLRQPSQKGLLVPSATSVIPKIFPRSPVNVVRRSSFHTMERRSLVHYSASTSREIADDTLLERSSSVHMSRSETISTPAKEETGKETNWWEATSKSKAPIRKAPTKSDSKVRRAMATAFRAAQKDLRDRAKKEARRNKVKQRGSDLSSQGSKVDEIHKFRKSRFSSEMASHEELLGVTESKHILENESSVPEIKQTKKTTLNGRMSRQRSYSKGFDDYDRDATEFESKSDQQIGEKQKKTFYKKGSSEIELDFSKYRQNTIAENQLHTAKLVDGIEVKIPFGVHKVFYREYKEQNVEWDSDSDDDDDDQSSIVSNEEEGRIGRTSKGRQRRWTTSQLSSDSEIEEYNKEDRSVSQQSIYSDNEDYTRKHRRRKTQQSRDSEDKTYTRRRSRRKTQQSIVNENEEYTKEESSISQQMTYSENEDYTRKRSRRKTQQSIGSESEEYTRKRRRRKTQQSIGSENEEYTKEKRSISQRITDSENEEYTRTPDVSSERPRSRKAKEQITFEEIDDGEDNKEKKKKTILIRRVTQFKKLAEAVDSDIEIEQDSKSPRRRDTRRFKSQAKDEDDKEDSKLNTFKRMTRKSRKSVVISQSEILNAILHGKDKHKVDGPVSSSEKLRKRNRRQKAVESVESLNKVSRRKRRGLKKGHTEDDAEDEETRSRLSKSSSVRSDGFDSSSTDVIVKDKKKTHKLDKKTKRKTKRIKSTDSVSLLDSLKPSSITSALSDQSHASSVSSEFLDSSLVASIEDEVESYSTITPVECYWVLQAKRALVCVHPVLGELRAHPVSSDKQDYEGWPARKGYTWQAFYDPEVYTLVNPYIDETRITTRSGQI